MCLSMCVNQSRNDDVGYEYVYEDYESEGLLYSLWEYIYF